jgi:hypothetical protein
MPVFFSKEPPEFRQFYDGQRWMSKNQLKNSSESGVIGAPAADVDTFNKVVKQVEAVESQLEGYVPTLEKQLYDPERSASGNPAELFQALAALQKSLSTVSLRALPLTDIQTLRDYNTSLRGYMALVQDYLQRVTDAQAALRRGGQDPRVYGNVEVDLGKIVDKLTVISQSITAQIAIYDSGVAQPIKLGGRLALRDDFPMYQQAYSGFP